MRHHQNTDIPHGTHSTTVTLANNVPIETVSKMLGHTNIKTTQYYAKLLDTRIGSDMEKLKEKLGFLYKHFVIGSLLSSFL